MTIEPCPFCGFTDVQIGEPEPGRIAIDCPECQAIGPYAGSTDEAAELWNAPTAKLRQTERRAATVTELLQAAEKRLAGNSNSPTPTVG